MEKCYPHLQVSIITCRRPAGLRRLLDALLEQRCDCAHYHVLVVDNDRDGSAAAVVNDVVAASRGVVSLGYEREPTPGIVFARNKCVELFLQGDSDALVFIDDDEWPADSGWLAKLVRAWDETKADIVTSHVISVGAVDVPRWALDIIYGENRLLAGQSVAKFYTNNLLLSRRALETVRPAFDRRFAMTGASDYHFALKCVRAGLRAVYADAPVVEEFPPDRARLSWFVMRGFRSGSGHTRSHLFEEGPMVAAGRALWLTVLRGGAGLVAMAKGCVTLNKASLVQGLFRLASAAGTLVGLFGVTHKEYQAQHQR